jgi:hypothetical protein
MPGKPPCFEIVKTAGPRIFLFVTIFLVLAALGRFAYLRFQSGDAYPPYSSFRTDPVGTKALYESMKRVEPGRARRNVQPIENLTGKTNTILLFGVDGNATPDEESLVRDLAQHGARVIIALDARGSRAISAFRRGLVAPAPPTTKGGTNTNFVAQINFNRMFGLDIITLSQRESTNSIEATLEKVGAPLPDYLPWYGRYVFSTPTNGNWNVIYAANLRPVVLEQKMGLGSIVVMADTFPFSNEALRVERSPQFLLWLFGGNDVVFDETHLGIRGGTGVAVLMREFRLHGLIAGCLLLAGLWIWRNAAPLVPPPQNTEDVDQAMEGKTAREAVVHLLRKNLSGGEALRAGLEEWAKAHPPRYYWEEVRLKEARELVQHVAASRQPDVASAQRKLSELLFPKQH